MKENKQIKIGERFSSYFGHTGNTLKKFSITLAETDIFDSLLHKQNKICHRIRLINGDEAT